MRTVALRNREVVFRAVVRVLLGAVAGLYLLFMVASHRVPFDPGWEVPLAFAGWLIFVAQIIQSFVTGRARREQPRRRAVLAALRGRWGLAAYGLFMLAVLALSAVAGLSGNLPMDCDDSNDTAPCVKIDKWFDVGGAYYRQHPSDALGFVDAPLVRISRDEYIAEVGSRLRWAALFGVFSTTLGLLVTVAEEGTAIAQRREEAAGDGDPVRDGEPVRDDPWDPV